MLLPSNRRTPREERPQSPGLTLRVAMLGGVAVVLFTLLFFRLWVLQVLSVEEYASAADQNQTATVVVRAPRGTILDREGRELVTNRPGDAVTMDLSAMPEIAAACSAAPSPLGQFAPPPRPNLAKLGKRQQRRAEARYKVRRQQALRAFRAQRGQARIAWAACLDPVASGTLEGGDPVRAARSAAVLRRLAKLTKTEPWQFGLAIRRGSERSRLEPVTLLDDIGLDLIAYLKEHGTRYPGIRVTKRSVREYRKGTLAAHVYGQIGEISPEELDRAAAFPDATPGDIVGKGGAEGTFDRWLRGRNGTLEVRVDARGQPQGVPSLQQAAIPGQNLRLTIDIELQAAAEKALQQSLKIARATRRGNAKAGAAIVMDVNTGELRAVASLPTFNPNRLVGRAAARNYDKLREDVEGARLLNRAVAGTYPAGSTYKPVTAIAAVHSNLVSADQYVPCTGSYTVDGTKFNNFIRARNVSMNLIGALTESCDTYFYRLGHQLYDATPENGSREPQAQWGRRLGFGERPGLDIGGDDPGVLPSIAFKREYAKQFPKELQAEENAWTSGDAVQTSIGQGHLLVTPLQIATLYALIANGGKLVTPHVGRQVELADGTVVKRFAPAPRKRVNVHPYLLESIRAGLEGVTHSPEWGTGAAAFAGFPVGVAGKTGTAERPPDKDYAWFAGYAPLGDPQLVAVVMIEQGGFGGETAAPAVRQIFAHAFGVARTASVEAGPPRDLRGRPIATDLRQMANRARFGNGITPASAAAEAARDEEARRTGLREGIPPAPTSSGAGDSPAATDEPTTESPQ
jgi:penicillin-binding protein 2